MDARIQRLTDAYRSLRQFDAEMDSKYQRDPSCNRRESLSLAELERLRAIEIERGEAAQSCTEEEYSAVVSAYNSGSKA